MFYSHPCRWLLSKQFATVKVTLVLSVACVKMGDFACKAALFRRVEWLIQGFAEQAGYVERVGN